MPVDHMKFLEASSSLRRAPCHAGDMPLKSARRKPRLYCECGPLCRFHWEKHRWNFHRSKVNE